MNPKIENSIRMSDYILEEFEKCKEDLQYFYNVYVRHSEKCRIFNFPKNELSKEEFYKNLYEKSN